jgi:hypothetical protein
MSRHVPTPPAEIAEGNVILVEQQKKEVRSIAQVGDTYEFTLFNWPVRPDSIPSSIVYAEDEEVTLILDDLADEADTEE